MASVQKTIVDSLKARRAVTERDFDKCMQQATTNKVAYFKMSQMQIDLHGSLHNKSGLDVAVKDLEESAKKFTKELADKYKIEAPKLTMDVEKATAPKSSWAKRLGCAAIALAGIGGAIALGIGALPLTGIGLALGYVVSGGLTVGGIKSLIGLSKAPTAAKDFVKGMDESLTSAKKIISTVIKGTSAIASAILFKDMLKAEDQNEVEKLKSDYESNMKLLDFYKNVVEGKDVSEELNKVSDHIGSKVNENNNEANLEQEKINKVNVADNVEDDKEIRQAKINSVKTQASVLIGLLKTKFSNNLQGEIENVCKTLQGFIDTVETMKEKTQAQFKEYMDNFERVTNMVNVFSAN